jgi:choline dehydrogenase-like flavoprotein
VSDVTAGAAPVAGAAEPHDVCVIGSGPAGAFVAHELVAAGARVVLVEAGEAVTPGALSHLPPSAFKHRGTWEERQAPYYPDGITGEVRYQTPAISVDRIRVLGGRSLHWNAVCLRFSSDDFREKSVGGIEEDWPISYDDLAPYYAYVERTIGVCGTREGLAMLPDGEFSGPPPPLRCAEQIASVACRQAGLRLIPTRKAMQVGRGPRMPCHYCGRCMLGCDVGAIVTTPNTLLPRALASGRLTLRTNALVRRLLVGTDGLVRAASVVDRKTKGDEEVRARLFVVSCGSIESARLLLNSACTRHPNGLANSSDLVGRYLTGHAVGTLYGYLSQLAGSGERRGALGALDHSYIPRPEVTGGGGKYVGGFGAQVQYADLDFPHHASRVGGFGAGFKAEVKRLQPALLQMGGFAKVIAQAANRVTVETSRPDRYGIPSPAIRFEFGDNDRALFADMMDRLSAIYDKAGVEMFFRNDRLGGLASHETGTCRMGADPRTSVLDPFCRAHDVANLFVVDGSPFVTLPEKNPTLTIMALAVRTARYIADASKRRDL